MKVRGKNIQIDTTELIRLGNMDNLNKIKESVKEIV
jgi:hypothetical protein